MGYVYNKRNLYRNIVAMKSSILDKAYFLFPKKLRMKMEYINLSEKKMRNTMLYEVNMFWIEINVPTGCGWDTEAR